MTDQAASSSTASNLVRGLLGCGTLVLAFFVVAIVAAVVMPSDPDDAPTTAGGDGNRAATSTIVATIQDFQTSIPLLEESGLQRQEDPNGIEYRWSSGASWIKFYDYGSDGKLERIGAVLATPQNDQNAQLMGFAMALRLVQVSSGQDVSADDLNVWFASVADNRETALNGVARTFGKTPMRLQGTVTADGGTALRLTIGEL